MSLRYGNVYGPRQDVHGEAGVVAIFCGLVAEGGPPTVYGDGRQTRDWVEVGDVVRANLLAADAALTGPVNIGHGRETSVLELLSALREVAERPVPEPRFVPARARRGEPQLPGREPRRRGAGMAAGDGSQTGLRRLLATI